MMFDMHLVSNYVKTQSSVNTQRFYGQNQSVLYQCKPFRAHVTQIQHITTYTRYSVFCWLEYSEEELTNQMA